MKPYFTTSCSLPWAVQNRKDIQFTVMKDQENQKIFLYFILYF